MDKYIDHEIYYELCEQLADEVTLSYRRKVLPTRMLRLSLPDSDTTYQTIGEELLKSGQFHKSIFPLKRVTIMDPHNHTVQINLAKALFGLEKENEAFSSIKKALSLNPEAEGLHNLLITELEERDRLQDLESFSKEIINMIEDPESIPVFYFGSAEALLNCEKFPQALLTYRKAMEYDPPMGHDEHFNYAVTLYYHGLFEDAIVQFKHVLESVPNEKHSLDNIAHLHYCLGRVQAAREEYEDIIQNGLATNFTYSNFLLVLYHLDEDAEVIDHYLDRLGPEITRYGSSMQKLYNEQLRITQTILQRGDIDEKTREFNLKKLEATNFVLSFVTERINSLKEDICDPIDYDF